MQKKSSLLVSVAAIIVAASLSANAAEKKYGPGVTDTEIKIGQTMPYSGPASAYGTVGRLETAYFEMINAAGGVNGRKISLISLDDSCRRAGWWSRTRCWPSSVSSAR